MYSIPKVGDQISVKSDDFAGTASVTYIDEPHLYLHHFYPIQCEVDGAEGKTVMRFSLNEIISKNQEPKKTRTVITENIQGNLFDF